MTEANEIENFMTKIEISLFQAPIIKPLKIC